MYVEVRQLGVHEFFLILSIAVHESLKETRERYQYGDRQSETVHAITVERVAGIPRSGGGREGVSASAG
jgi:hypothetical protein